MPWSRCCASSRAGLGYAAARLGSGSDVLGLDDEMSRDHDWGCLLTLLVDEDSRDQVPRIRRMLEEGCPTGPGFPVRFPVTWDSSVSHKVEVATVAASRPAAWAWTRRGACRCSTG